MSDVNPEFWTAVATISPLVLVAMAATMPELLSQNRRAVRPASWRTKNNFIANYITGWVLGTGVLGGLMTVWGAAMLAAQVNSPAAEAGAVIGLLLLMFGLFAASWELWTLTRDLPRQDELLHQIVTQLSGNGATQHD